MTETKNIIFYRREVLQISEGIHDIGTVRWELAGVLLLAWFVCYVSVFKGAKSTGKVWLHTLIRDAELCAVHDFNLNLDEILENIYNNRMFPRYSLRAEKYRVKQLHYSGMTDRPT